VIEFRACFAKFHLLFRSQHSNVDEVSAHLAERIPPHSPDWIRDGVMEAVGAVWGSVHHSQFQEPLGHPPGWRYYVVDNRADGLRDVPLSPKSRRRGSQLMQVLGFDVEEVQGWASRTDAFDDEDSKWEIAMEGEYVPLEGCTYLRVTEVDESHLGNGREPVQTGDIIMTLFGRGGGDPNITGNHHTFVPELRSRWEFVALAKQLPFLSLQVYRQSDIDGSSKS